MDRNVASVALVLGAIGTPVLGSEFMEQLVTEAEPSREIIESYAYSPFSSPFSIWQDTTTSIVVTHRPVENFLDQVQRVAAYLEENATDFDLETKTQISKNLWNLYD